MFLDCVHQLLLQKPRAFEFGQDFLVSMMDAAISGRFGTFLYDCERERLEHDAISKTPCFLNWSLMRKSAFSNPLYHPLPGLLQVSSSLKRLEVWRAWFLRYN